MAQKERLSKSREGTSVNNTSEKREGKVAEAIMVVYQTILQEFGVRLHHESKTRLKELIGQLKLRYPDVQFHQQNDTSSMAPDGGTLYLCAKDGRRFPILITEVKNQGTNDLRQSEGKKKQAKGNAIERLGKNVIGYRTAMLGESIFPFICFGDGCDFAEGSSILDRVITISMFGKLNEIHLHNEGPEGIFNRGSFFFRERNWTPKEMADRMLKIARGSIQYYFEKYSEELFRSGTGFAPEVERT